MLKYDEGEPHPLRFVQGPIHVETDTLMCWYTKVITNLLDTVCDGGTNDAIWFTGHTRGTCRYPFPPLKGGVGGPTSSMPCHLHLVQSTVYKGRVTRCSKGGRNSGVPVIKGTYIYRGQWFVPLLLSGYVENLHISFLIY